MNVSIDRPILFVAFIALLGLGLFQSFSNITETQQVDAVEAPDFNKTEQADQLEQTDDAEETVESAEQQGPTIEEIRENKSQRYRKARPITDPKGYINTDNVLIERNIGNKVILLDMWTYSCINCQRTFPHLKEWHRKYKDDGLLIIGNHAPEFEFEKDKSNVEEAVERFNLTYPIVLDNEKNTWEAYNNRYWPQKYLIGIDGFIRYEHIGEGSYNQTEQKIVELLEERKERLGIDSPVDEDSTKKKLDSEDVNFSKIQTPEIYFGAFRNEEGLGNQPLGEEGEFSFEAPENIKEDTAYLDGTWQVNREYATGDEGDKIKLRYTAEDVNMVLRGNNTKVRVKQDGKVITNRGEDLKSDVLEVNENMLYRIVENPDYETHTLELEVIEGELDAFTFTFG